jgi:hypothetical protein
VHRCQAVVATHGDKVFVCPLPADPASGYCRDHAHRADPAWTEDNPPEHLVQAERDAEQLFAAAAMISQLLAERRPPAP